MSTRDHWCTRDNAGGTVFIAFFSLVGSAKPMDLKRSIEPLLVDANSSNT